MNNLKIRYIVVDDSEADALMVQVLAAQYPCLECVGVFQNALDAFNAILRSGVDLVFLDIEMPEWTGIDLLKKIKDLVPVNIFISSHAEFALEGFELSAFDFILKPATEERFARTIKRVEEYLEMKKDAEALAVMLGSGMISIKQGHQQFRIPVQDIIYLEAMGDYTKLLTTEGKFMVLSTLGQFMEQLPEKDFSRIHRSYAVANNKIQSLNSEEILVMNKSLPVGKTYRKAVKNLLS